MTDVTASPDDVRTVNLDYDGRAGQFAGIVVVNLILQILTLGIFRFWARTRERRYLWSHVSLSGDRLEYTGTGMELFIGFLVAMVGLAIIGGIYQLMVTMFAGDPVILGTLVGLYFLVILFLVYFAIYNTRRYRLTRTVWRGIRGTMNRAAVRYAVRALGYYLLSIVTIGLAAPIMRVGLTRFEIENMRFGDRPFSFDGRAGELFRYWLVPWLILAATIGATVWLAADARNAAPGVEAGADSRVLGAIAPALQLGALAFVVALVWYRVREFRYLAGKVSFEGMAFSSNLGFGRVVWIYVSYVVTAILLFVVLALGITFVAVLANIVSMSADVIQGGTDEVLRNMDEQTMTLVFVATGLGMMVVMQTLGRVMVFHRLAHAVVTTLALTGDQDFRQVAQALDTAPSTGEGLADAFDLGNF